MASGVTPGAGAGVVGGAGERVAATVGVGSGVEVYLWG